MRLRRIREALRLLAFSTQESLPGSPRQGFGILRGYYYEGGEDHARNISRGWRGGMVKYDARGLGDTPAAPIYCFTRTAPATDPPTAILHLFE